MFTLKDCPELKFKLYFFFFLDKVQKKSTIFDPKFYPCKLLDRTKVKKMWAKIKLNFSVNTNLSPNLIYGLN